MKHVKTTTFIGLILLFGGALYASFLLYRHAAIAYYEYKIEQLMKTKQNEPNAVQPLVSVVLPTYNRENTLPHAIDSILAQTMPNFELLVINDGSKDNTAKILYHYMLLDKRVWVINHPQNQGIIAGLNEGLAKARGKYVARMDDDDYSLPKRFAKQVEFLENNPDVALVGTFVTTGDENIDAQWSTTDSDEAKILHYLGTTPICHPAIMLRSSFLRQHNIKYRSDYIYAEDRPLYGDIILAGGKISNVPETLFRYRIHHSNNKEYYTKQGDSAFNYHLQFINQLLPVHIGEFEHKCILLSKLQQYNSEHNWVKPSAIKALQSQHGCLADNAADFKETETLLAE